MPGIVGILGEMVSSAPLLMNAHEIELPMYVST